MMILYCYVIDGSTINTYPPCPILLRNQHNQNDAWTHAFPLISLFHQSTNLLLEFLFLLRITPISGSVQNGSTRHKINLCFIPRIGGNPFGISSGKTSSNSCKRETIEPDKEVLSWLVLKSASLYKSTIIGLFKNNALLTSLAFA